MVLQEASRTRLGASLGCCEHSKVVPTAREASEGDSMSAGELLYAEAKRLQEQCARLQDEVTHWRRQIEILWEIGTEQMTMEQLENARKGKLIWEAENEV
jgi:hypothetical protein